MSKVPAWKRMGLQVKKDLEEDPLATTTHLDGEVVTNKMAKKLNKKRQLEELASEAKQKKPPKKAKLPKAERKPPPVKDQLTYLREYASDRENWKFSKQKQNWLLKNIDSIPQEYEKDLISYVEGIQGGARTRLEEDLRAVIVKWNKIAEELESKVNAELYGDLNEKDETEKKAEEKAEGNADKETEPIVTKEYAVRCKKLLMELTDEKIELLGVPEEEPIDEKVEAAEQQVNEDKVTPAEDEDNLVINDVEVETYQFSEGEVDKVNDEVKLPEKEEKKEKREKKKAKKTKKGKSERKEDKIKA